MVICPSLLLYLGALNDLLHFFQIFHPSLVCFHNDPSLISQFHVLTGFWIHRPKLLVRFLSATSRNVLVIAFLQVFHSFAEGFPQMGQLDMGLLGVGLTPSQQFLLILFPSPVVISDRVNTCRYKRHLLMVLYSYS